MGHFIKYILLLLLLASASADVGKFFTSSSEPDFYKSINGALPVVIDLVNSVFGKVNKVTFGFLLEQALKVVADLFPQRPLPTVPEVWWGDVEGPLDPSIRPFKVNFTDEMIRDLRARISSRRPLTRALRGAAHAYGSHAALLEQLLQSWARGYDFSGRQAWLNRHPQFTTNIQGLNIHYIHVKPLNPKKKLLPLLLVHGWPVTAFEYVHVIDYLVQGREECDFEFEIIAPDLPGFGYSEATNKIGMSHYQMAVILKNLMLRLGKPRFYVHAGDVGQAVADSMAVLFPDRVLGLHTNFAFSLLPQTLVKYVLGQLDPDAVEEPRYQDRLYPLSARAKFYLENFGYFHIQATRPDNLGHGLDDSPVALASWLLQSIIIAASEDHQFKVHGFLNQTYDMLDWLDTFTVYWASQSMGTSVRMYAEGCAWLKDPLARTVLITPISVPFAAIRFRHELIYQPDGFLRDKYPNLVQASTLDFGGHFAGYEEPAVLVDSIWMSVKKMQAFNAKRGVVVN